MNSDLHNFSQNIEWKWPEKSEAFNWHSVGFILMGLLPFITTSFALLIPAYASVIYGLAKSTMLISSWKIIKEIFQASSWNSINIKRLLISTVLLGIPPILFLTLNTFIQLDVSGIEKHIEKFNLTDHLIFVVTFLCIFNALLEEAFFRGYLSKFKLNPNKTKILNAIFFMPHHFAITIVYFSLPLACLFTFATGVAAYIWMDCRLKGARLPELWISHFVLDVIVIAGALLTFNLI